MSNPYHGVRSRKTACSLFHKTVCVTRARLGILCARVEYRYLTCGGTGFVELNFRNPSMEAHGFELTHTDQP